MKAKDVRTLESVLLEYGMSSGASTPTSQQQTGASAKANKKTSPTTQKTTRQYQELPIHMYLNKLNCFLQNYVTCLNHFY